MHDEAPTPVTEDMAGLYPEEAKIVDSALVFARTRLTTESARWEHARIHPRDAIVEAARLGLNRIEVALDRGGLGMRFLVKLRVAQALAREDMAFSFALVNAHNAVLRIARDGTPAHRERWLPGLLRGDSIGAICLTEPDAGSDFSGIRTRATRRPGGWTLVGEKAWATNAVAADHALVYAQTDPGLGYRGIAAFLVPVELPGVRRSEPESLVGAHAIGAGGFGFDGVELDEGALFYPPGEAFKRALASINGARTYVAGMRCAMLERSLELAYAYARSDWPSATRFGPTRACAGGSPTCSPNWRPRAPDRPGRDTDRQGAVGRRSRHARPDRAGSGPRESTPHAPPNPARENALKSWGHAAFATTCRSVGIWFAPESRTSLTAPPRCKASASPH
ncbi:MAG: acyl-CoA dehydrogenase family protein [Burkholderiaceae bacterium]